MSSPLDFNLGEFSIDSKLTPTFDEITLNRIRTNVRVGIITYMKSQNEDNGNVLQDELIEDSATLEVSCVQIWQWLYHKAVTVDGTHITPTLISTIFDEELDRILQDENTNKRDYSQAMNDARILFLKNIGPG